jgi:hypothetical protein
MKNSDIVNHNEVFLILAIIILMIMATAKLSPSYPTSLTPSQVIPGPQQDKIKQIVDTNAFSNLSRNMTSSTVGQSLASNATDITTSVSSKSSALAANGNSNSTNKVGGGSSHAIGSSLKSIHNGSSGSRPHLANSGGSSSRSGSLSTSSSSSG